MNNNTAKVAEFLKDWQYTVHEDVETVEDIQVYNVVGTIGQLLSSGYMELEDTIPFVFDYLTLDKEVKERIRTIFTNAIKSSVILH